MRKHDDYKQSSFTNDTFDYINQKLPQSVEYANQSKGQDLVLMLGSSGSGKSTTGNYLLGHEMVRRRNERGSKYITTKDKATFSIAKPGADAETLYSQPAAFLRQVKVPWMLVDCPGFFASRLRPEDLVVESISVEMVARQARQIKALLIFIPLSGLQGDDKWKGLINLTQTLSKLFKDPESLVGQTFFIVTRADRYTKEEVDDEAQGSLTTLLDHCKKRVKELSHSYHRDSLELNAGDYALMGQYVEVMLKHLDHILRVDPLDEGESREEIISAIENVAPRLEVPHDEKSSTKSKLAKQRCPITAGDFRFQEYSPQRYHFERALYFRCDEGNELIQQIEDCRQTSIDAMNRKADYESRTKQQKKIKRALANNEIGAEDTSRKEQFINLWREEIKANDRLIENHQQDKNTRAATLETLEQELERISVKDSHPFTKKPIRERHSRWPLTWIEQEFEANTGDTNIPIIDVELSDKDANGDSTGKWTVDRDDRDIGVYRATYRSRYSIDSHFRGSGMAQASATAYIQTRHTAHNMSRIRRINEEIPRLKFKITKHTSIINELEVRNQQAEIAIADAKSGLFNIKKKLQSRITLCDRNIEKYQQEIRQCETTIEAMTAKLQEKQSDFIKQRSRFDFIVSIAQLLGLDNIVLSTFIIRYKRLVQASKEGYSAKKSNGRGLGFDPITGNPIKNPVFAQGLIFDEEDLAKQFPEENPGRTVFRFDHKGESIAIKWGEWQKIMLGPSVANYEQERLNKMLGEMSKQELEEAVERRSRKIKELERQLQKAIISRDRAIDMLRKKETSPSAQSLNSWFGCWAAGSKDFDVSGLPFDQAIQKAITVSLRDRRESAKMPPSNDSEAQLTKAAARYGYKRHNVAKDGNCFFHAVAHQLNRLRVEGDHETLRLQAAIEVAAHPGYYGRFMTDNFNKTVKEMAQSGIWAGQLATQAIARLKQVIIVVIPHDGSRPSVMKPHGATQVIVLGNQVNFHFQSLLPEQDGPAVTKEISSLIEAADFLPDYEDEKYNVKVIDIRVARNSVVSQESKGQPRLATVSPTLFAENGVRRDQKGKDMDEKDSHYRQCRS